MQTVILDVTFGLLLLVTEADVLYQHNKVRT